jgi:hypothetical protein
VPLSKTPTPRGTILLSCLVKEGEGIECSDGTSKAFAVAQVEDGGSGLRPEAGCCSARRQRREGRFCPPQANHE